MGSALAVGSAGGPSVESPPEGLLLEGGGLGAPVDLLVGSLAGGLLVALGVDGASVEGAEGLMRLGWFEKRWSVTRPGRRKSCQSVVFTYGGAGRNGDGHTELCTRD